MVCTVQILLKDPLHTGMKVYVYRFPIVCLTLSLQKKSQIIKAK